MRVSRGLYKPLLYFTDAKCHFGDRDRDPLSAKINMGGVFVKFNTELIGRVYKQISLQEQLDGGAVEVQANQPRKATLCKHHSK